MRVTGFFIVCAVLRVNVHKALCIDLDLNEARLKAAQWKLPICPSHNAHEKRQNASRHCRGNTR